MLPFATTWMDLEGIMLSETSQTEKHKYCMLPFMYVCVSGSVVSDSLQPHGLYSPPGSFIYGILQARVLEWVAIPFSRGSSQPGIKLGSPTLKADSLPSEPLGKPLKVCQYTKKSMS